VSQLICIFGGVAAEFLDCCNLQLAALCFPLKCALVSVFVFARVCVCVCVSVCVWVDECCAHLGELFVVAFVTAADKFSASFSFSLFPLPAVAFSLFSFHFSLTFL